MGWRDGEIEIKTPEQLALMRVAGLVVADGLAAVRAAAVPGATTADLDAVAREVLRKAGATSSFLGYGHPPFPAAICASVNDEIVHGIPGSRVLNDGDLVSIDFGAIVDGWHGDAAITVAVGEVAPERLALSAATEGGLWAGIAQARAGGRLSDIGHAVERHVRRQGAYGILEDYVGHGIGTSMHMDPQVPNYGKPGKGPRLVPGMALAIEPMVTQGSRQTRVLPDDWTVATQDGSWAAHWEHTVAITPEGPWVLTAPDGGAERLAALGVPSPAASRP